MGQQCRLREALANCAFELCGSSEEQGSFLEICFKNTDDPYNLEIPKKKKNQMPRCIKYADESILSLP